MWLFIEPALIIVVVLFVVTQMVIPPFIGKRFFWIFRKSEKRILAKEDDLAELRTEETEVELDRAAKTARERIAKKKASNEQSTAKL